MIGGSKVEKSVAPAVGPAEVEQLVPDGVHTLLRLKNGSLASRYLYGPAVDQILADEQLNPSTGQTDRLLWPLADNLGTIRDVAEFHAVTGTTSVVNHVVFDSFGRITSESDPSVDHAFGYTGRDRDSESDLYYYRARYYDPATGRFVSEDPIGFAAGDGNLNRYVGNGVTNAVDPSGLAEGHHWVPIYVAWKLFMEGIISKDELAYSAGRRSGPLKVPHNWGTTYDGVRHCDYNELVEREIREWKKAKGRKEAIDEVVDNIRDGKSWDGYPRAKLRRFNSGIKADMVNPGWPNPYDIDTPDRIRNNGLTSLRRRGKILIIGGTLLSLIGTEAKANDVANVLQDGKGIRSARDAAINGKMESFRRALIGLAHPCPSVYEELKAVDLLFAEAFWNAVTKALNDLDEQLPLLPSDAPSTATPQPVGLPPRPVLSHTDSTGG